MINNNYGLKYRDYAQSIKMKSIVIQAEKIPNFYKSKESKNAIRGNTKVKNIIKNNNKKITLK